jgi:hypothetical protein
MAKGRKRASGGGRKPDPHKKVMFSMRLNPELMGALKQATQTWPGRKVSTFAEYLLNKGLRDREESKRDPAMRALSFVIAETAHQVVGIHRFNSETKQEMSPFSWRSDPFFYRAFKLAVGQILDALEPKGEIKSPKLRTLDPEAVSDPLIAQWVQSFETPEARAEAAADHVLSALATMPSWTTDERERARHELERLGLPSLLRQFYQMADAAEDLKPEPRSGKTKTVSVGANILELDLYPKKTRGDK